MLIEPSTTVIGVDSVQAWEITSRIVTTSMNSALSVICQGSCWTRVWSKQWIVYNDESGTVTAVFYCGCRLTVAILMLIPAVIDPLLSTSSNHCIASTQMLSDCSIRSMNFFISDQTISFKFWHLLVMFINHSARHYYSQHKIFAVKMQQKFWWSDWDSLYIQLLNVQFRCAGAPAIHLLDT